MLAKCFVTRVRLHGKHDRYVPLQNPSSYGVFGTENGEFLIVLVRSRLLGRSYRRQLPLGFEELRKRLLTELAHLSKIEGKKSRRASLRITTALRALDLKLAELCISELVVHEQSVIGQRQLTDQLEYHREQATRIFGDQLMTMIESDVEHLLSDVDIAIEASDIKSINH